MNIERYNLKAEDSLTVFEFVSSGPNGHIIKIVKFSETNLKGLFNLAFGDKDSETGDLNDLSISNNGDSEKVLATIISAVYAFTDYYPNSVIYATGSTKARTRLYRMGITKYLDDAKKDFYIYGQRSYDWEPFEKNIDYDAFIAKRKNRNFTI
jgi:hypothetical protein